MKPHTCPRCDGDRRVNGLSCPACEGKGIVWEPVGAQEGAQAPQVDDPMDLTYRPGR